jgi:hypothetical protein
MKTLLDAVQASGASQAATLQCPKSNHALEILVSGTFATLSVALKGSVSAALWETLATHDFVAADFTAGGKTIFANDKLVEHVLADITAYNSGTAATGSFLSTGVAPASGDTITIDTTTYKFQTANLTVEGNVIIGASAATALINLGAAINHTGVPNVDYKSAAAHATASASTITATKIIILARTKGVAGNSIALAEVSAQFSKSGNTLGGGVALGIVTINYSPYPKE